MAELTGKTEEKITEELVGVIFKNPLTDQWESGDEYLSGNVRDKLNTARTFAESHPEFTPNVRALEAVQPRNLEASEIEVRVGATWIEPSDYQDFMTELLHTPWYLAQKEIQVKFSEVMVSGGLQERMRTVQEMRLHMQRMERREQMPIRFWKIL